MISDMLKKFQACIDLKTNCLHIADERIPFLYEKDLYEALPHSEDMIRNLVDMGFPRDKAESALHKTNGNPEAAASLLMGNVQ